MGFAGFRVPIGLPLDRASVVVRGCEARERTGAGPGTAESGAQQLLIVTQPSVCRSSYQTQLFPGLRVQTRRCDDRAAPPTDAEKGASTTGAADLSLERIRIVGYTPHRGDS